MRRLCAGAGCLLSAILLSVSDSSSQTVANTARQLDAGAWKAVFFYQGTQDQHLNFAVGDAGNCVAAGSSGATFPCTGSTDVEGRGNGSAGVFKLLVQPYDKLQYYISAGAGSYNLSVPSGGVVKTLTGDTLGGLYGAGVRAIIVPEIAVRLGRSPSQGTEEVRLMRPAVAVDASGGWQRYHYNRSSPAATEAEANVDQRLDLWQLQVAVEASQSIVLSDLTLEPYGGVKWFRNRTDLKDLRSGGHTGGVLDTVTPFAGLNVPVGKMEGLFAEVAFINGIQYGAGLNIRFK